MSDTDQSKPDIEFVLPSVGLAIACEEPTLQLCKPKLLPLKTYSYMKMQLQAKNKLDRENTKTVTDEKQE